MLNICERLVVLCMPMYLKMSERNLTQKQESVFVWVTKGYRLYDPKHAKVFHSRDVVFNELK